MKTAIIDVGGGLRGIYAWGVFDSCLNHHYTFDLGIGISAGSANLASFVAGQYGRNIPFYKDYPYRTEYMSAKNLLTKHAYLDLDYIYGELSNEDGENPLDYDAFMASPMDLIVIATDAETGEPRYFTKEDFHRNDYRVLKASSAIPFVCQPFEVDGRLYYDGALSDTIPIEKAFSLGCDKVVLVLTKPRNIPRTSKKDVILADRIKGTYPKAAEGLATRAERYNQTLICAKEYEDEGRLLIISPHDTRGVDTLKKNQTAMDRLYWMGYTDALKIRDFLLD